MNPGKEKPLVVITGSSGLIGSGLVDALRDQYRLACLDVQFPQDRQADADVAQIECDLTDQQNLGRALSQVAERFGREVESVIHLAAYYDFSGEPSPMYRKLTLEGTRHLLRELQTFQVHQFVFSSTLLVMSSAEEDQPLTTASPVEAEWDYPRSKLATEAAIRDERKDIPAVILRIAGVYNEDCHTVPIAQQIHRIYEKKLESYFFPGDKSHGQSFIHLEDLVTCFRRVIEKRGELAPYEVFLIGEEDVMSYGELQDHIGELIHGKSWPTIRIPKVAAKAGAWVQGRLADDESAPFIKPWMIDLSDQNYPVSVAKARRALGWHPQHTLRGTLPEIVRRLQHDPERWYEINGLPLPEHAK
jgi:nucleoside-diphosphate-sugar epimerase